MHFACFPLTFMQHSLVKKGKCPLGSSWNNHPGRLQSITTCSCSFHIVWFGRPPHRWAHAEPGARRSPSLGRGRWRDKVGPLMSRDGSVSHCFVFRMASGRTLSGEKSDDVHEMIGGQCAVSQTLKRLGSAVSSCTSTGFTQSNSPLNIMCLFSQLSKSSEVQTYCVSFGCGCLFYLFTSKSNIETFGSAIRHLL